REPKRIFFWNQRWNQRRASGASSRSMLAARSATLRCDKPWPCGRTWCRARRLPRRCTRSTQWIELTARCKFQCGTVLVPRVSRSGVMRALQAFAAALVVAACASVPPGAGVDPPIEVALAAPGASKDRILDLTRTWIAENFRAPPPAIQSDNATGVLSAKVVIPYP